MSKMPLIGEEGVRTDEIFDAKFSCHPIVEYTGDDLSYLFQVLRKNYEDAGIEVLEMNTYFNSGIDWYSGKREKEEEFGIEVKHV